VLEPAGSPARARAELVSASARSVTAHGSERVPTRFERNSELWLILISLVVAPLIGVWVERLIGGR
jgi:hypothetical protein